MSAELAFGITAASRPGHERLATELERLGYREVWSNDTRRTDGLATLAEMAPGGRVIRLGVGVVALSDATPDEIARRVAAASLPADRFTLGVGSGSSASLELVRRGVESLRDLLPGTAIAVAAVGPRMAALAGEMADAVVANWALPGRLASVRERVAEGAARAGRRSPRLVAYVRTAVGDGADGRLLAEMDRYRRSGGHYARAFAAQGEALVGVAARDAAGVRAGLGPYRGVVETLVVRGLPADDSVEGWLAVARASAGGETGPSDA